MPKKTVHTRGAAQRHKPKVQKSIELVRQTSVKKEVDIEDNAEPTGVGIATSTTMVPPPKSENQRLTDKTVKDTAPKASTRTRTRLAAKSEGAETVADTAVDAMPDTTMTPKSGASARLAARRQAAQKAQRSVPVLISAEHYSYVRKDLIFIAILAAMMFSAIIILHFVPAIGG